MQMTLYSWLGVKNGMCMSPLLKVFSEIFEIEINWEKSFAYWFDKFTHKLIWLDGYK